MKNFTPIKNYLGMRGSIGIALAISFDEMLGGISEISTDFMVAHKSAQGTLLLELDSAATDAFDDAVKVVLKESDDEMTMA